jgi:PEP-CTERM motif
VKTKVSVREVFGAAEDSHGSADPVETFQKSLGKPVFTAVFHHGSLIASVLAGECHVGISVWSLRLGGWLQMRSLLNTRSLVAGFMLATVVALAPKTASATPLSGTLNITDTCTSGPGCLSGVNVTTSTIDWFPTVGGSDGQIHVGGGSGDFTYLVGTLGTLLDLNSTDQPVGSSFPLSGSNANLAGEGNVLPNFMTFASGGAFFDLNNIFPGVFSSAQCSLAPAAGQVCTPYATSPFNLVNTSASTSSTSLVLSGFVRNTLGELSTFVGTFTTQSTQPFQVALATLLAGGTVTNTYSATFTATITPVVPEPATLLTLGTGLMLTGWRARRRRTAL